MMLYKISYDDIKERSRKTARDRAVFMDKFIKNGSFT